MSCNWVKIFDQETGGNVLNENSLHAGDIVYLDISEMPNNYTFLEWRDSNGNTLDDSVVTLTPSNRYMIHVVCGGSFIAVYRIEDESSNETD